MNINKIYFPLIVFTAIAIGFLLGGLFMYPPVAKKVITENRSKQKLNRLIDFIEDDYVDKINTDSIVDLTVNGILQKLDPHSVYIAKKDIDDVSQSMKGNFVGIGVNFFMENDTLAVINPIKDGPSDKAGIQPGDRILSANNEILYGKKISTQKLYSKLKGKINSEVLLTIFRKSENKKFKVKVIRNTIAVKSVDVSIMLIKNIGYIKINRFAETTYREFKLGLSKLIKQGATNVVVDVRDNGGGYLDQAVYIIDEFLKDKSLIVFTKNKKGNVDKTFATSGGIFESGKIAILINENSASASEILAGAIQDNDRGVVFGRRSFGKGLVQQEMPLGDGSSVRLTVSRYYTPAGRSIQKSYSKGNEAYFDDFIKRYENGELYAKDSIKIADTLKYKTTKGRIVYGGGGIVPDIFVPIETTKGNEIIPVLMQSGAVTNFVFTTIDDNRKEFKGLNFQNITSKINNSDQYFELFKKYVASTDTFIDLDSSKNYIKRYLTAEFCRQLLGENQYYQTILKDDEMIKQVVKYYTIEKQK
jgi:carboxyl-terminal processing protease